MNKQIPGIDGADLSVFTFAQMYLAIKKAEEAFLNFELNKGLVNDAELKEFASDNRWYIDQATMYASAFVAAELADDSPKRKKFQEAIQAVEAHLRPKQIPRQRVPGRN